MTMKLFVAASFGLLSGAAARSITVYNACPFTIWPAMFTGAGDRPNFPTGWEAPAWSNVTIEVPENWTSGRIWVSMPFFEVYFASYTSPLVGSTRLRLQ
ncbi:hypothetical protein BDN72DRAFT_894832 [Pluteus cervinus]|uniref:Uncharacterized protein n=1 Tax=Pluteus cervinus TaxID=181527 RepID=A0ACD3B371_9AGAR|nr:hypothetical protein BDN72DRAFT_894832 [Pluteus cervinus]